MKNILILILGFCVTTVAIADSLNFGLLGLSGHSSMGADARDWQFMKRKISETGKIVWNPEANLTYEHRGWLLNATYLRDCQDFDAYYFGAGYRFDISKTLHASVIGGIMKRSKYYLRNDLPDHVVHEWLFVPWVSLEKDFPITDRWAAFASFSSNYALSHVLGGAKFSF